MRDLLKLAWADEVSGQILTATEIGMKSSSQSGESSADDNSSAGGGDFKTGEKAEAAPGDDISPEGCIAQLKTLLQYCWRSNSDILATAVLSSVDETSFWWENVDFGLSKLTVQNFSSYNWEHHNLQAMRKTIFELYIYNF